jgi:hypothetical protein
VKKLLKPKKMKLSKLAKKKTGINIQGLLMLLHMPILATLQLTTTYHLPSVTAVLTHLISLNLLLNISST